MTYTMGDGVTADTGVSAFGTPVISWAAIIAGAVVASATTLILIAIGSGFSLASISPWEGRGASAGAFTVLAGVWLIITQWVASAAGGYLTGRLRTRWSGVHDHEVFFRDTAHGFITWAVATLVVAGLIVTAGLAATQATAKAAEAPYAYEVDSLFRGARADDGPSAASVRAETVRILAKGEVSAGDRAYINSVVASRTGLSPAEAGQRVDAAITQIKSAADDARKAASATALFTALSMLIGAFIACVASALGGKQRDEHA